jgi:hypothetical protein
MSQGKAVGVRLFLVDWKNGADDRTRTGDLCFTKALLYQLSYIGALPKIQFTILLRPKTLETTLRPLLKGAIMLKKSFVMSITYNSNFQPNYPNLRFTKALLYQLSYIGALQDKNAKNRIYRATRGRASAS